MKFLFTIALFLTVSLSSTFAVVVTKTAAIDFQQVGKAQGVNLQNVAIASVNDFLALTPSSIKAQTGKKLSFKEVIGLKIAQKKLKKAYLSESPVKGKSDKTQLIAFLLCTFLGGLGIHRFYLGYTVIGIVQLLTGGGCGIWALIDWIRLIGNNLPTKDGQELEPW